MGKTLSPPMTDKVFRLEDVKARKADGDTRLYYCDPDIDLVMTTITKPVESEWHRHNTNTETYYVFNGELTLDIDDHTEVLCTGDMMVIYPGAWHRFRTGEGEVVFCAIKKIPLLNDKETRPS